MSHALPVVRPGDPRPGQAVMTAVAIAASIRTTLTVMTPRSTPWLSGNPSVRIP